MSRSIQDIREKRPLATPNGFTLAELLVSMAIFLTIMAGVAAVFAGSVDTVRQGYRNMEAFEIGRSTLGVLEQDLKNAFTARELGQYFQFFGMPNGFMIVGALDNGQLGRVTYAVNEGVGTGRFETIITDSRGALRDRLVSQGQSLGLSKADATTVATTWMPGADGSEIIEVRVIVETGGLIRYAEPGLADLDTLPLPPGLQWPNVDPTDPSFDTVAGSEPNEVLYKQVLLALNPDADALNYSRDIRTLIQDFSLASPGNSLTAIRADTIKTLVEARKREIWVQMLAGDTALADFWSGIGKRASDYVVADSVVMRAVPLAPDGSELVWPGGIPAGEKANLLFHPAFFFYSNSVQDYSPFYNALQNIEAPRGLSSGIGYVKYMEDPSYQSLFAFDRTLSNLLGETRLAADTLGSPLLPQLPNIVRPGFWLMKPATRPGGADFRRWFGQGIDVPSAFNRSVGASMVPNPSQV